MGSTFEKIKYSIFPFFCSGVGVTRDVDFCHSRGNQNTAESVGTGCLNTSTALIFAIELTLPYLLFSFTIYSHWINNEETWLEDTPVFTLHLFELLNSTPVEA